MIFVDSNVPMYIVGGAHPNKDRVLALLTRFVSDGERLITDVEVYQEILHRFTSIRRQGAIDPAFDTLDGIVDDVFPFGMNDIRVARALIVEIDGISARDALHVAVMQRAGCNRILSFDAGFDAVPGLTRLS